MKVKFTKLAALLLAGAALLAAGCTDYEVDIQKVDKRVDELAAKTAADLQNQVDALNAAISKLRSDHDADITSVKGDIKKLQDALDDLNADFDTAVKRLDGEIAGLKTADDNFKTQIEDLIKKYDAAIQKLTDEKADKTELAKVKTDLEAAIAGEKARAEAKEAELEAAIKKINEETIPALQSQIDDLQNLKLDAATFEEYKAETAQTIALMQDAIDELADTKLDKTEFQETVDEIIAKFDDYVLTTTFEEFKKIAATKQELKDLENTMQGKIDELKKYVDDQDKAVKEYVDGEVKKLEDKLDELKSDLKKLEDRVKVLEDTVADIVDELAFAEGDLKGYIDDAAAQALEDAIAYTDEEIAKLKSNLMYYIQDIYNLLFANLQRIQSVVFVPTHDDLKITTNVSIITQDVVDEETGEVEKVAFYLGQPTDVTYKVTPTEYAPWLASYVSALLGYGYFDGLPSDKMYSQLYKDYYDYEYPAVFFDVKALQTRADEEEEATPSMQIVGVKDYDADSGEIVFSVMSWDIASPEFLANANKPSYEFALGMMGDEEFMPLTAYNPDTDENGDVVGENIVGVLYYLFGLEGYTIPVWKFEDHMMYELRKPFAASLTVYCPDADNWGLYMDGWTEGSSGDLEMDDYFIMPNEVSSPYNVLYPDPMTFDILPEPYKPELDENGDPKVDEDGYAYLIPAMEEHQELPYSSLRENPVGEKASQDPKGYRVILDGAVPAVSVNGDRPMTLEDASMKYDLYYPIFTTSFDGFEYDQNTAAEPVDEENFVETNQVYAEIEMNPAKSAAERKDAIGNLITGTYSFTSFLGSFKGWGDVLITPALGEVDVDATIVWTWENDAPVDHNLFYTAQEEQVEGGTIYNRMAYPLHIDEEDLAYIDENLDINLASFADAVPTSVTISYTDKETGETVEVEYDPVAGTPAEGEGLEISGVAITEDGLVADIINFEWDQVYTIVAVYELPDATITVNGTLTTIDRNREKVVLSLPEYIFTVNYLDEETGFGFIEDGGWYKWESDPLHAQIFKLYDENGVINVEGNEEGDFEYDAEQEAFNEGELTGNIRMAASDKEMETTAWPYVDINRQEIVAKTKDNFTSSVLASMPFNSGLKRDENDPNLWHGETVTRNITTFIGEEVQIEMIFSYKVPDYNFLHLAYYTFNTDHENGNFIQLRNFNDNDGSVIWWTQVNPSYFTTLAEEGTTETQAQERVSNRYALADYDVAYINLAELAFNVVDENDDIIEDAELEELGLNVKFVYTDETQGEKELPEVDQIDDEFLLYDDLWVDNTVFYYRTNEKKFIPSLGQLTLTSGDYDFPVATRFEFPKAAVKFPEEILDYSTYAMVRWTPFKEPVANGNTIVLDENKIYREPLFKGMFLQDNRPNGVSFYVIKDGEWVVGNAAEDATAASGTNGYIEGIAANDAYHITTDFVYDTTGIPAELKKLLTIEEVDGVPYVVYDYTSEVQFHGVVTIPVVVKLENPWQETLKFVYNVTIKGYGD